MTAAPATTFLESVRAAAVEADVFDIVEVQDDRLRCSARDAAEEAWYRIEPEGGTWMLSLVTADRWLSESIEADLMHYGDPIEELVEEELVELGWDGGSRPVKHFRSPDMLYTFCTALPIAGPDDAGAAEVATTWLRAYEAAFRELGDMSESDDD